MITHRNHFPILIRLQRRRQDSVQGCCKQKYPPWRMLNIRFGLLTGFMFFSFKEFSLQVLCATYLNKNAASFIKVSSKVQETWEIAFIKEKSRKIERVALPSFPVVIFSNITRHYLSKSFPFLQQLFTQMCRRFP